MSIRIFLSIAGAVAPATVAAAESEVPHLPQALLDVAYESGDPKEIAAVAKAVKAVFPDYEAAIEAQTTARIAELNTAEESERAERAAAEAHTAGGGFALKPWKGKIQAGAALASGNTDNLAANLALDAARTDGDFTHNVTAYIDFAESDEVTNQKRWGAAYQLDYQLSEITYAYGRFSYDEDDFSGFDYRLFAGAGLGHFLWNNETFIWKVEGGPGYRISPIDDTSEVEKQLAIYAASETDWIIREGIVFEQDLNATWTSPTTTFQSITALRTSLTDSLSTALSFEVRYETDPPAGRENTDTITRASLIYGF